MAQSNFNESAGKSTALNELGSILILKIISNEKLYRFARCIKISLAQNDLALSYLVRRRRSSTHHPLDASLDRIQGRVGCGLRNNLFGSQTYKALRNSYFSGKRKMMIHHGD